MHKPFALRRLARVALILAGIITGTAVASHEQSLQRPSPGTIQFIVTSDAHYGLTRPVFRGHSQVTGHVVNAAMIATINALPGLTFPADGGLRGGERIGAVDFVAETGDIANRAERTGATAIQSAAVSWSQFKADYIDGLTVKTLTGRNAPLYVVPGNHDASNAVGFYRPMTPAADRTAMVEIYNLMMAPAHPATATTFDYARHKAYYARDIGGIHFMFVQVWPDSAARAWMETDLARIPASAPVIVFTHDEPDVEAKHFINPNGRHDINAIDRFENLLSDTFADGATIEQLSVVEQRAFERFLERHPNVTAYFHGNSNWNQFYDWTGPDRSIVLHTFRVDSPMKGAVSATDETKLSLQVVTLDTASHLMTVRECLWNPNPRSPSSVAWGGSTTVALSPRPAAPSIQSVNP